MTTIEYYLSTDRKWFIDLARELNHAAGGGVYVEGNHIIFPESFAEGRYEFYELPNGLAVLMVDCLFKKELQFIRRSQPGNEHFKVLFNISGEPMVTYKDSGRIVDTGSNLLEAVLFSSSGTGLSYKPPVNARMKVFTIIFQRSWGNSHLLKNSIPVSVSRMQQFVHYEPMQFTTSLDLHSQNLIREAFEIKMLPAVAASYIEGVALNLVAILFNNLVEEEVEEEKVMTKDALVLEDIKAKIVDNIYMPVPVIEDSAKSAHMSKTKFATLFRLMYGKNYSDYFYDYRMQRAKELLKQGMPVGNVGHEIGYSNLSHFAKAFKLHTGMTPKAFRNVDNGDVPDTDDNDTEEEVY